jgi:hypothetical protein
MIYLLSVATHITHYFHVLSSRQITTDWTRKIELCNFQDSLNILI